MLTQAEFANWQNYHASVFSKFAEWFLGMLGNDREPLEMTKAREGIWFNSLKQFNADDLMAATVAMAQMPRDQRPKFFDEHLSALLEILNRPKSRPELLRKVIQCDVCQDTGIVDVTAIPGTAIFSAGGVPMPNGTYCAVDCNCPKAVWYRDEYQGPKRARYDPNAHELRQNVEMDRSSEIIAAWRERGETAKANAWERFLGGGRIPRLAIAEIGE